MNHNKKKLSKKNIILIVISCILIPVIAYCSYISYLLFWRKTPTFVSSNNDTTGSEQLGLPTPEESGIDNIVLFGVDSRTPNDYGRTDSIIIATIDKNSKAIKLTSVMRDLYVKIGSTNSMSRINSAYAMGGPELALETLNNNFGLDLKYYALIDFKAFQEVVDKL
ncbi:MAG TPA: LytR family transcriptional regulator, partial [Clostridiaceae bacterium]|nr:LytR family transcriptional regulator [Clostridiaceae bacterium]